jgi:hypothetical protein
MTAIPPPQYDHPPSIPVIEKVLSYDAVQAICPKIYGVALMPGQHYNGCGVVIKNVCYIWRVDNDLVRRHERAHCSGWPKDHPGGH